LRWPDNTSLLEF